MFGFFSKKTTWSNTMDLIRDLTLSRAFAAYARPSGCAFWPALFHVP